MNLSRPFEAVAPSLHGAILVALHTAALPLSGRAVAERAGASQEGARRVLRDLAAHGLVHARDTGSAVLYSLNRDHVLAEAVRHMAEARLVLFDRMAELVATWSPPPTSVTVFGSTARRTGDVESDVDVLVVGPDDEDYWDEHVPELSEAIRRWTGNGVDILDYSLDALHEDARANRRFIEAVAREGRVVYGASIRRLLIEARRVAG